MMPNVDSTTCLFASAVVHSLQSFVFIRHRSLCGIFFFRPAGAAVGGAYACGVTPTRHVELHSVLLVLLH